MTFDHLVQHALTCTLEKDFEDVSNGNDLVLGTISEVIDVRRMKNHALNKARHGMVVARSRQHVESEQKATAKLLVRATL